MEIGLHELHAVDAITACGVAAEPERCAREISGDNQAIRPRQVQRHLTGSAPDFSDGRVGGNRTIEQRRQAAALRSRAER